MTWGHHYWPWYLAVAFAAFIGPEIYALATDWHNTLSAWIWNALRVQPGQPITAWTAAHLLVGGMLLVLFVWLLGHLLWGIWAS